MTTENMGCFYCDNTGIIRRASVATGAAVMVGNYCWCYYGKKKEAMI